MLSRFLLWIFFFLQGSLLWGASFMEGVEILTFRALEEFPQERQGSYFVEEILLSSEIPISLKNNIYISFQKALSSKGIILSQCEICVFQEKNVQNGVLTSQISQTLEAIGARKMYLGSFKAKLIWQNDILWLFLAFRHQNGEIFYENEISSKDTQNQKVKKTKISKEDIKKDPSLESYQNSFFHQSSSFHKKSNFWVLFGYHRFPNIQKYSEMFGVEFSLLNSFSIYETQLSFSALPLVSIEQILPMYDEYEGELEILERKEDEKNKLTIKPFSFAVALFAGLSQTIAEQRQAFLWESGVRFQVGAGLSKGYFAPLLRAGLYGTLSESWLFDTNLLYAFPTVIKLSEKASFETSGGWGLNLSFGLKF